MLERKPTNINWSFDSKMPDLDDYRNESYVSDETVISFDYNGYKIEAQVQYSIDLKTDVEEGGSDEYGNTEELINVIATDFELDLIQMFYNDGEDFKVPVKELIKIENNLLTDLQIQY